MTAQSRTKISLKHSGSSLLGSLTDKLTLSSDKATTMALKPYLALDCFVRKQGTNSLFGTLVQYAVVTELLCQKGYQPESASSVEAAQRHLINVSKRGASTGQWIFEREEYDAMCQFLAVFSKQLSNVSPKDLREANLDMMEQLLTRIATKPAAQAAEV